MIQRRRLAQTTAFRRAVAAQFVQAEQRVAKRDFVRLFGVIVVRGRRRRVFRAFVVERDATKVRGARAIGGNGGLDVRVVAAKHKPFACVAVLAGPHGALLNRTDAVGWATARFFQQMSLFVPQTRAQITVFFDARQCCEQAIFVPRKLIFANFSITIRINASMSIWQTNLISDCQRIDNATVNQFFCPRQLCKHCRVFRSNDTIIVLCNSQSKLFARQIFQIIVWERAIK